MPSQSLADLARANLLGGASPGKSLADLAFQSAGGSGGSGGPPTLITQNAMGAAYGLNLNNNSNVVFDAALSVAGPCAFTITGFPAVGIFTEILCRIRQDATGGRGITLPTVTWMDGWTGLVQGYAPAINLQPNAATEFFLYTLDGGATLLGRHGQRIRTHTLRMPGVLVAGDYLDREYFESDSRIVKLRWSVGTAPAGAAAVADLKLSGATMYPTNPANRPSIAIAANTVVPANLPDTLLIPVGGYLTGNVVTPSSAGTGALAVTTVES